MEFLKRQPSPAPSLDGIAPPDIASRIIIETSARARRLGLRVEPARDCVVLVRPRRASNTAVTAFVAAHMSWICDHLKALPARVPFADGAVIPFQGVDHVLKARPQERGGVWREEGCIIVTGQPEHMGRRVTDWLKTEARSNLATLVNAMAATLGREVNRITVRDTRSRWGSCAQGGRLSFSWRLILAPPFVLRYVAAHETAHLLHANHGPAFKRATSDLLKPYGEDPALARAWLGRHGSGLHRFG